MKKLFVLLLICISGGQLFSQSVAINNNGTAPDPTSMLDISSTTKGVLIPRMRTLERTAIVNPAEGLLVFDIDTRTFWFFSNSWNEIGVGGNGGQNGLATGDLSGTYPAPNVVKLQNLDVAFGVPLDKQVLKWDMQANTWKGMNDSLFLPYNSTFADAAKLFSITNTQTNNGATAIYGRSGNTGSGMIPVTPIAIWGDNSTGGGILGTSFNGVGTYGYSAQNHGVFGFTNGTAMAGVYGYNNNNGYGIMGENFVQGAALYGKAHGVKGKAALFENINLAGTDTVLKVTHAGLGPAGYFLKTATTDASTVLTAKTEGLGHGIEVTLPNVAATGQGIRVVHHGMGDGLFVAAKSGRAAYFANDMTNTSSVVEIHNTGTNKALQVGSVSTSSSNPSITVSHAGEASALMVTMYNNAALAPGINVQSSGQAGIAASATANNSIAVKGQTGANATGGIAVLGIAGANDASGIGVKGQSNSPSVEHGAITGINSSNGIGVFGQAAGNDGIGMYGRSGNGNSQTKAAVFENINASNTRPVVEVNTNGSGNAFAVNSTKVASNSPVVEVKNAGTGHFILLEDGNSAAVTSVTKAGNIYTNGTVSVKGNKGTLRNSFANHLRYEAAQAVFDDGSGGTVTLCNECSMTRTINFAETFDTAPTVTVGNLAPGFVDIPYRFQVTVNQVTTSGFTIMIYNNTGSSRTFKATWKLAVIGNDD